MRIKGWVPLLFMILLGLCRPVSAGPPSTTPPTILHFVTWKADNPDVWDEAIAQFESAHPGILIEREIAPHSSTAYHDLLTQKLKNHDSSMDLFLMDVIWPAEFAAAGWVLPLDLQFPSSERKQFLTATIEAGMYRGHIYGVPSRIDSGMLYYRTDLLEKYGFEPPETWQELVDQSKVILTGEHVHQPGLRGYSGQFKQYEGLICNLLEFIGSNNGSFLSEDGTHSTLTAAPTIEALAFVRDQIISRLATPASLTYQEPESLAVFVQGKAIFHRNWPYAWGLANNPHYSKIAGQVGVAALPHFPNGQSVSALGGWLYGISAYSRHSNEAWAFIRFMTSAPMQKLFALHASLAPSRQTLYSDTDILSAHPQFQELFPVFQTARPRPRTPVYPIISHLLQRFLSRVLAFPDLDIQRQAGLADRQINYYLHLAQSLSP